MKHEHITIVLDFIGNKPNAVDLLLKAGANLNVVDNVKRSGFHHVAMTGNEKILDILLAHILTNNGVLTSASQETAKSAEDNEEGRNATHTARKQTY